MSSSMNLQEARKIADKMSYKQAIYNCFKGKSIPYKTASLIKIKELLDVAKDTDKLVEQIRNDTINECKKEISRLYLTTSSTTFSFVLGDKINEILDQLKEKQNGNV